MADEELWTSADEEETKLIDRPSWVRDEGATDPANEETMALDFADELRTRAKDASGDGKACAQTNRCRSSSRPAAASKLPLLDGGRAVAVDWQCLPRVASHEKRGLERLFAVLPPAMEMEEITDDMASSLEKITGIPHGVRWTRAGTAIASAQPFELGRGLWTWGRMPPDHHRFVAGVHRDIADGWSEVLGDETTPEDPAFRFGMVTAVIAECCGALCQRAQWPPFAWAVNPMEDRDLEVMLLSGASPLLELSFQVQFGDRFGALRLWFPIGLVRQLESQIESRNPLGRRVMNPWFCEIPMRSAVIAGTATLRPAELRQLEPRDVMVVRRHGIGVERTVESSTDTGARWHVGDNQAVVGRLFLGDDNGWKFEVRGCRAVPKTEEVVVTKDASEGATESVEVALQAANLDVDIRIGSLSLTLGELSQLRPGQVLDCDCPVGSPVELVVGGSPVATGELVAIDGKLGVRIVSRIAPTNWG